MNRLYIRKFSAVFLLSLFVFCNTPVHVLHSLFADHTDQTFVLKVKHSDYVDAAGIHCQLNNNIVTEPYLPSFFTLQTPVIFQEHRFHEDLIDFLVTGLRLHSGLRAPPELS